MKKFIVLVLCILFLILPLTSCYDAKELDEWAYVYTLGIDKGAHEKFRITLQLPSYKKSGGGGGVSSSSSKSGQTGGKGESGDFSVISIDCPSLYSGLNMINTSLSRTVNLMHCKYIMISEELAKQNIGYLFDAITRDRQIRRITHLIVVKGEAGKIVKAFNPVVGTAIAKTQEGQMTQVSLSGLSNNTTVGDFLNNIKSTTSEPFTTLASLNDFSSYQEGESTGSSQSSSSSSSQTPGNAASVSDSSSATSSSGLTSSSSSSASSGGKHQVHTFMDYTAGQLPRKGGNEIEYLGTAIFDGGKMIGELDGGETQVLKMMQGNFNMASFVIKDPIETDLTDTMKVRQQAKPKITVKLDNGKPKIILNITLDGDLQQVQSIKGKDDTTLIPLLQNEFTQKLKDKIDQTFEKCRKLNCDVFDFGGIAVRQFPTIQEWESYNWLGHFKDASLTTNVEFVLRRDGTLLKDNPIVTASRASSSTGSGGNNQSKGANK